MRKFIQMSTILKEHKEGKFQIHHFSLSEEKIRLESLRAMMHRDSMAMIHYIKPNYIYTRLTENGQVWMSDTPMELHTNDEFMRYANGNVLIFGLGMGAILAPLKDDPNISHITVVELNKEIIDLIGPYFTSDRITIVEGDAYTYDCGKEKYDTIYFDIWQDRCSDNYEDMKVLHKRYRKNLNKENSNKWMSSWLYDWAKSETYRNKRSNIW